MWSNLSCCTGRVWVAVMLEEYGMACSNGIRWNAERKKVAKADGEVSSQKRLYSIAAAAHSMALPDEMASQLFTHQKSIFNMLPCKETTRSQADEETKRTGNYV